jgi:chemotaxis protein MotB
MIPRPKTREAEPEPNAMLWLVTYADMMSLLLCFFVMLVAMSEIKDEKFQKMLDSLKKAFGYQLGMEVAPGTRTRTNSFFENLRAYRTLSGRRNVHGGAETINVRGKEFLCKSVREGWMITVGDRIGFAQKSAEIPGEMKGDLDAVVELVKDYSNRVLVGGHTCAQEVPDATAHRELSFRRADAVGNYLEEKGINPRRLRLSACGAFDPVDSDLTPEGRTRNRRVEIVVSEELVHDAVPGRGGR